MAESALMSSLPDTYELVVYSNFQRLAACAARLQDKLEEEEMKDGGQQQFIVVIGLSANATTSLSEDKNVLGGVGSRFEWDGPVGVIKVMPSVAHDFTTGTSNIRDAISNEVMTINVRHPDYAWGQTTTHKGAVSTRGKQPDESFSPNGRLPCGFQLISWPTMVIETGVSESLPRL